MTPSLSKPSTSTSASTSTSPTGPTPPLPQTLPSLPLNFFGFSPNTPQPASSSAPPHFFSPIKIEEESDLSQTNVGVIGQEASEWGAFSPTIENFCKTFFEPHCSFINQGVLDTKYYVRPSFFEFLVQYDGDGFPIFVSEYHEVYTEKFKKALQHLLNTRIFTPDEISNMFLFCDEEEMVKTIRICLEKQNILCRIIETGVVSGATLAEILGKADDSVSKTIDTLIGKQPGLAALLEKEVLDKDQLGNLLCHAGSQIVSVITILAERQNEFLELIGSDKFSISLITDVLCHAGHIESVLEILIDKRRDFLKKVQSGQFKVMIRSERSQKMIKLDLDNEEKLLSAIIDELETAKEAIDQQAFSKKTVSKEPPSKKRETESTQQDKIVLRDADIGGICQKINKKIKDKNYHIKIEFFTTIFGHRVIHGESFLKIIQSEEFENKLIELLEKKIFLPRHILRMFRSVRGKLFVAIQGLLSKMDVFASFIDKGEFSVHEIVNLLHQSRLNVFGDIDILIKYKKDIRKMIESRKKTGSEDPYKDIRTFIQSKRDTILDIRQIPESLSQFPLMPSDMGSSSSS